MTFLTDLADQAVVLPAGLTLTMMLLVLGWRRGALAWAVAVAGTLGVMLLLKLLFAACGTILPGLHIHSPSGHTAAAAVVYGGLALLFARPPFVLALSIGAAIMFGMSRVALGFHTVPEVIVGGCVGVAGTLALIRMAGRRPVDLRYTAAIIALVIVVILFHGHHVRAETAIGRLAYLLHFWPLSACYIG